MHIMDPSIVPRVHFNNGNSYPAVGFGTYEPVLSGRMAELIGIGYAAGYRMFDCALLYKNEDQIGEGFANLFRQGMNRSEIQVTSKLWNTFHKPSLVRDTFELSRSDLKLDYLDLYLIHWPMAFKECSGLQPIDENGKLMYSNVPFTDTWKEFEKLFEDGLSKNIGVCNFNTKQLTKLLNNCRIKPVVNQCEVHPYLPNIKIKDFCDSKNIVMEAFSPLGSGPDRSWARGEPDLKKDPYLLQLADKYGKSTAQICVRFLVQRRIIPLPKSASAAHIQSNLQVFDFCLSDEEMNQLLHMIQKVRYNHFDWSADHPDYPFHED